MLPPYLYLLAGAALLVVAACLSPFARGRRWLTRSLPALVFFALLFGVAEAAWHLGAAHGGARTGVKYTCSMHPQVRNDGPGLCPICHMELVPLTAVTQDQGGVLAIDPAVVQHMGVRVREVGKGELLRTVHAFGSLRAARTRERDVALKFDAFVEQLFADTEGMRIEAGAPLFSVYAPELVVAQEELIAARKSGDAELLAAARQKLLLWDLPPAEVDRLQELAQAQRTLNWPSPVAGTLVRRDVAAGAPAPKNQVLLRIVDLSLLWLDAQVPEAQLAGVRLGEAAAATVPGVTGPELQGEVIFVAPMLDETTRTATVRVAVPNPQGRLKPGMFARVRLHATLAADAVLVPQEAVLDTGARQVAWVAVGRGRFESRQLQLGPAGDDGLVQVLAGLAPGDQVVLSGQFLIDAESRLREGARRFGGEGLLAAGDVPAPTPIELSPASQQQVDLLLGAYLRVAAAFAAGRHDQDSWQAMTAATRELAAAPEAELQRLAGELALLLQAATGDVAQRRLAFKLVSAATIRLFARGRPQGEPGQLLYVHHCPMVKADWLQLDAATRNPYDTSMLQCGEVVRTLPLGAGRQGR